MPSNEKNKEFDFLLDEVLKAEPEFMLPDDFAEKMATKIAGRFAWEQYFKEFLVYLAAFAGFVAVLAAMAFIWFKSDIDRWSGFLISNISWVVGSGILIVFVLFADRVVLRYMFYKKSVEII